MNDLMHKTAMIASKYLDNLKTRPVYPSTAAIHRLSQMGDRLPDSPVTPEEVLELLDDIGSPATVASAGGTLFWLRRGRLSSCRISSKLAGHHWDPKCHVRRKFPGWRQGGGDSHSLDSRRLAPARTMHREPW